MGDMLHAVRFAYRHSIRSGRQGFLGLLIEGIEVMEVGTMDLIMWAMVTVLWVVVPLTLVGETIRVVLI
jgi:hypothetical protein